MNSRIDKKEFYEKCECAYSIYGDDVSGYSAYADITWFVNGTANQKQIPLDKSDYPSYAEAEEAIKCACKQFIDNNLESSKT